MTSFARIDTSDIDGHRLDRDAASGVSPRVASTVVVLLALQLLFNAALSDEAGRAAPYVVMLVLMGIAGWNAIRWHVSHGKPSSFPALHYVVFALGAYVAFAAYWLSTGEEKIELTDVARYAFWIIGYFFFYAAAQSHAIGERHVRWFLLGVVPVLLVVLLRDAAVDEARRQGLSYSSTSSGYACLALIPWALLLKRSFLKNAAIVLCAIGVVWSIKRGAVLALFAGGFVTSILVLRVRDWLSPRRLAAVAVLLLAIACAALARSDAVKYRLGKGNADREALWSYYTDELAQSNVAEWCFGHGAVATKRICISRAHCDWIEIGFNYGLIGLALFASAIILLCVDCARSLRLHEPAAAALCFSIVVFLAVSLYSGMLTTPVFLMYSSIFGLARGRWGVTSQCGASSPDARSPSLPTCSVASLGPPSPHCVIPGEKSSRRPSVETKSTHGHTEASS